ncbi:ABC transporter substrate-binding protein [Haladaptatus sp. DYF46]|uniref:ABC transporter substrate-binding protein n=1 Tax=Haladaptatus sp. DYF46 TaxID=2886041 RepID=UPI001E4DE957|nr:ABC transporter substrate-binding protein [Haladaptatus sp. DYF46]
MPRDNKDHPTSRRNVLKVTGATGAASLTGLAGCSGFGSSEPDRDHFKLGVVTSLSGDLRFGGNVTRRGYELWKKEVNSNDGIEIDGSKYEVKLTYADAKSDPSTGADAASKMISNEKVDAVLGPYSSGVTLAVAPIMDKNKMPHITGSAESPQIWQKKPKYTFGTIPTVAVMAKEAAKSVYGFDPAPKSVYITGVNTPFSKATSQAFRSAAKDAGVNVAGYELFPRSTDYSNVVTKAKNASPDFHFHGGHIGSHVDLVKAAKQIDYSPNGFMCHYGVNTSSFKEGAGAAGNYLFGATVWLPKVQRSGGVLFGTPKKYTDAAKTTYDSQPDYTQAASTAAGIVFQKAFEKMGVTPPLSQDERNDLVSTLEDINVNTFYGDIQFETDGEFYHNNVKTEPLAIQLGKKGESAIVGPKDAAEGTPKYPVPGWNKR